MRGGKLERRRRQDRSTEGAGSGEGVLLPHRDRVWRRAVPQNFFFILSTNYVTAVWRYRNSITIIIVIVADNVALGADIVMSLSYVCIQGALVKSIPLQSLADLIGLRKLCNILHECLVL